jgi:hypothetical protein
VIPYGYFEIGCKYIGQFGTVTIATPCETFLLVIVIIGGAQMTKDEGWGPHLFFFVLDHRHAFSIVVHNESLFIDVDSDIACFSSADVVRGIDKNFVEYLVQGGYDLLFPVVDIGIGPYYRIDRPNISVGSLEYVIYVG